MKLVVMAFVLAGLLAGMGTPALANHGVPLAATYQAAPPAQMGAAADVKVSVTLTNTGDETWRSFVAPATAPAVGQVALSYHWYDPDGKLVVWEGLRSSIGADLAPNSSRAVEATVRAPANPGSYQLKFAIIKEGVAWAAPSPALGVRVVPAYQAKLAPVTLTAFLTGAAHTVNVPVTNAGSATWTAAGANPITLSYHWHNAQGNAVVWDGVRTKLTADLAPNATTTIAAQVIAPTAAGAYTLTFDLVREGVSWFQFLGSTPLKTSATVAPILYTATYSVGASVAAYTGETKTIAVTITNTGNVPWTAQSPVNLGYHIVDSAGRTVVWDGQRATLGEMAVGASKTVQLAYASPTQIGSYTLVIDAVREGVAWFSSTGTTPVRLPLPVTSGFSAGYGASTTPAQATIGATVLLSVDIVNYGPRTLSSKGTNPVNLSYHIFTAAGAVVVWDGKRAPLPVDLAPGQSARVEIEVALPSRVGDYVVAWDLVHEGIAWLSQFGIPAKREPVNIQPGVTFYGKGFGHGVGMSQYGAQGYATGAVGAPLSGEQIVARYYTGTAVTPIPAGSLNTLIRVLLSAPSSQGRYRCGDNRYYDYWLANLVSAGGFKVLTEPTNGEVGRAGPNVTFQIAARNGVVEVWDNSALPPRRIYSGASPAVLVPLDPSQPIKFSEKGTYRGNLRFTNLGGTLRVVNVLNYDDYTRGVIALEMPYQWHPEALKAQAYAARTYAYTSYQGGARDYDVSDDQADQCYGGFGAERPSTNTAVNATAGKIVTSGGTPIRTYFSSSSGGYTLGFGCWGTRVRLSGSSYACADSPAYLTPVADQADIAVTQPTTNKHSNWSASFTSSQIRDAVLRIRGRDIGTLLSVDLSNRAPVVVGHLVSVKIIGSNDTVEVPADVLLRDNLFLKSTQVRLAPW